MILSHTCKASSLHQRIPRCNMPTRKSGSSEAQPDSRRTSLRRLSSIASFQTLFTRRRSNNNTDRTAASSSSNLSLSSTAANAPEPSKLVETCASKLQKEDSVQQLPPPPEQTHPSSRRSSYICLPDDPIGGMPRSRTFSNLPLPTKAKKTMPMMPLKSHSRLPSAFLPSTRLPSPSISNRKHSHSRLASAESKAPVIKNRVKRSDTEPLLKASVRHGTNLPRSTAFKENMSLSPIKPLPAMEEMFDSEVSYGSSMPTPSYPSRHEWNSSHGVSAPFRSSASASSLTLSNYAHHPAIQTARGHKSSPVYRDLRGRPPTPGIAPPEVVQRWNSQPVLTNATNLPSSRRNSQHREIRQTRLMSARQAPTPPPPKTPLSGQVLNNTSKVKSINNSSSHVRQVSEQTPLPIQSRSTLNLKDPSPERSRLFEISTAEPTAYWCGRLCALADRYRNEELATLLSSPTSSKTQTDKMHCPEATTARLRRALEHLHDLCVTQEAEDSLVVFQLQYASMMKNPDLSRPIVLNATGKGQAAEAAPGGNAASMSEVRKVSFMDLLLGRQKRRSLVLS